MKSIKLLALVAIVSLFFYSCDKDNSSENLEGPSSISESISLEASTDAVERTIDENVFYGARFLRLGSLLGKNTDDPKYFSDCAAIEMNTVDDTTSITITFEGECEDHRGNLLSGTMVIAISKTDSNKGYTVTFDGLSVNGYVINGTKSFNYTVENANGNPEMSSSADLTIETDEGTVGRKGNRLVEVTAGGDTDTHQDDEFTITGSHTHVDASENSYSVEITTPLVKPAECRYIASGIKEFTKNEEVATLDYGDGTCDDMATLTEADGTVTEIKLRKGRKHRGS